MMKTVIAASLVAGAAAFAPVQHGKVSTSLNAFEAELGVQPPIGFWDPLGLLDDADQERFDRLRYVEIKHGRISMLAFLGYITPLAGFHWDNKIDFAGNECKDFPNGLAAFFGDNAIPTAGFAQIFGLIGIMELFFMKDIPGTGNEFVGDFRNGWLDFGWDTFTEEEKLFKRGVELNNGRAAMMGILGLMIHEKLGASIPIVGDLATLRVWEPATGLTVLN